MLIKLHFPKLSKFQLNHRIEWTLVVPVIIEVLIGHREAFVSSSFHVEMSFNAG